MSFLFKSSKKGGPTPNALPPASRDIRSADGPQSQIPTLNGAVKPASPTPGQQQGVNGSVNGSLNSLVGQEKAVVRSPAPGDGPNGREVYSREATRGPPSPEQRVRNRSQDEGPRSNSLQSRTTQAPEASPYPWSQRKLSFTVSHTNPFPRYGAAVNSSSSKDGSIFLMGGLINGSTVKGDLWMVETGGATMSCYPIATTSEGPGPRVGHASLLVGNAFIVFGGDTKMDEGDALDDTLYLLNTSTKQWSRALPAGQRPPGRYGHTLNILGSKIYIFGGQVEGYFFNDLVAFDLNALQQASNRWEILVQNTIDGGPPHGQIPPARTNHTMITWGDRLYLFGGTDGVTWFNDVWSYYPHTNSWTQLECIGYIPSPREGHAAALVGDVMYIFGGRTEEGTDLGDLAAFRITSRRWYTFQNMGPSPSPRSGHSMTTVGKSIVILAGEPSSAPRDPVELGMAYLLDTSKIRYPPDSASQTPTSDRIQGYRRPSGEKNGGPVTSPAARPQPPRELMEKERSGSTDPGVRSESASRLPRVGPPAQLPAPSGPPPQQQPPQPRVNGVAATRQPSRPERALSPTMDPVRAQQFEDRAVTSPTAMQAPAVQEPRAPLSPGFAPDTSYFDSARQKPETYQPSQDLSEAGVQRTSSRSQGRGLHSGPGSLNGTPRDSVDQPREMLPKVKQLQPEDHERPQDSGIGSSPALTQQHDELIKELDAAKQKNAWFASELALARKSGYQTRSTDSPVMDDRATEIFSDDDKPLIEALLKMRAELARVQETIDEQSKSASARIAEMERQRDAAVGEAVFAKAKLAGHGDREGPSEQERDGGLNKRLATSIATHGDLNRQIAALTRELEMERQARAMAEQTAEAAQKRVTELDTRHQQLSTETEDLRSGLHEAQTTSREVSANHHELLTQHRLLTVDKDEIHGRHKKLLDETQNHAGILTSLQAAVTASTEKSQMLEQRLERERAEREGLEQKLASLRSEHESRTAELETTSRKLQDAEDLAQHHSREADTHRSAVLAGFGRVSERDLDTKYAADERVAILQQQLESADAMVRQNQAAADAASAKLRGAEERIAGLEVYQEQASREGLTIRKQLQGHVRDLQGLNSEKSALEQKLQSQQLETNALAVQHGALKDILSERGINPTDVRRSRAIDSPSSLARFSTPDLSRVRELEQQLDGALKSHEDMKTQFEDINSRDEKMKREYEEKLTALDNDHQAAVKYLRGTEKMLSKMKQELQRVKNENADMRKKLDAGSKRGTPEVPTDWEAERANLRKEVEESHTKLSSSVSDMEARLSEMQTRLQSTESELESTRSSHTSARSDFAALQQTHTQTRGDIERLQHENEALSARAQDAENKVQLLLDQVEHSVDNYRRQSRMSETPVPLPNGTTMGHSRNLSELSTATSTAGGGGHSRNVSDTGDSTYSITDSNASPTRGHGGDLNRNSLALDSLASELETLRSHWETTSAKQNSFRLSERFDFEKTPTSATSAAGGGLAGWRKGLDVAGDEDEGSRPGTAHGGPSS
ncbi:hypothetical protein B0A48_11342 [Cryoendolithus antarcticus]|uniref:Uncharacterized protein n=1 Tax=Cryoendolithus antarcticus TaxID=1507870 RepID=A0A1V8SV73_9PEZI|nr:hypothetical protein B0A48_11342 [Cryoendolithus antarcticus]